jgi:thiol-disulfide isomerase/thioredoxin
MPAALFHSEGAPEFKEGLDWINTRGPVRLEDLRGRVVLLDFWTYGCINCRHVQPRLRELERRFPDTLTVIGVHAGKFAHERITPRLAEACDRQGVEHAVVNDRQYRIWRAYGVQAWPTVALIGADGALIGLQPGEFPLEPMAEAIASAAAAAQAAGTLVLGPDPIAEPQKRAEGVLRFPGRVVLGSSGGTGAADGASAPDRLWIADTGHGRVLECSLDESATAATVLAEHGGFNEPQGMLPHASGLFVADRADQAVWRIDAHGDRHRVAGTGKLADIAGSAGYGPSTRLRSPWGLAALGDQVVVSMAGSHQLWRLDPVTLQVAPWAGTSGEDLVDGQLSTALLSQPTGVSVSGDEVAFADSESSAIRLASEEAGVSTLVGTGLFEFGDRDGVGDRVLLQHAEDLAFFDHGTLVVADTYNDRLKRMDVRTRESEPWAGQAGKLGALREPAGVSSFNGRIAVADTAAHRVVLVEPGGSLAEVRLV